MTATTYELGSLIYVKHGIGKQIARVEGFTKSGRIKVRAYNASRGQWMQNLRTILFVDVLGFAAKEASSVDLGKGWRVGLRDEAGNWVRDERGFVKHEWVPLPALNVGA